MKLNELLQSDHFEEKEEICPGCQNHCQVRVYSFANGRQYVSGNNCERVYSNEGTTARKGINMFEEKYKLLFEKSQITKTKLIAPLRQRICAATCSESCSRRTVNTVLSASRLRLTRR